MYGIMILLFLIALNTAVNGDKGVQSEVCKPYKAVIIWETQANKFDLYLQQKHFIVDLIKETPDNSIILLKVIGIGTILHFKKDCSDDTWLGKLAKLNKQRHYKNVSISFENIKNEVSNISNTNLAEEYFIVVDECSEMEEQNVKALKRKKMFVAFAGDTDPPAVWTRLSTSNDHLIKNYSSGEIGHFIKFFCRDLLLVCDTDMYWNGFRCYRCSYICTSTPSEFCKNECPYYTTPNTDKNISESKVCNNNYVTPNTEKHISESNGCDNSIQSENCIPFKAVIIWDTYTEEYRFFYYQRVFIVKLINEMPDNSKIYLKILGSDTTSFLHFDKDHLNDSWVGKIAGINDPAQFRNNSISIEIIKNDVFDILNTNMAEEYFFVVNECSEIEEQVIQILKKQKTFVAFAGDTDPPAVWTRLSTSKEHLKNLNDDVHGSLGPFLDILCRDSLLMCDTDMYWNGFRCYRCSYICTSIPSEFCQKECPYYGIQTRNGKQPESTDSDCDILHSFSGRINAILTFVIISLVLLCIRIVVILKNECDKKKNK